MLKTLTLAIAALLIALSAKAETFIFSQQGFSLNAPDDWHVMAVADTVQMVNESDFGEELKNAGNPASQLLALVRDNPVVGVSPGVFVNYHRGTVGDIEFGLNRVASILERNLRDFQVVLAPTPTMLGPYEAGSIRYRYVSNSQGIDFEVIETFWLIPDGDHYITISGGLAPEDEAKVQPLIDAMASSMKAL